MIGFHLAALTDAIAPLAQNEAPEVVPFNQTPMGVLTILLGVLAVLFGMNSHPRLNKIFKVVPLLVFCYFVPTLLSNTGLIPIDGSFPLYSFTNSWRTFNKLGSGLQSAAFYSMLDKLLRWTSRGTLS